MSGGSGGDIGSAGESATPRGGDGGFSGGGGSGAGISGSGGAGGAIEPLACDEGDAVTLDPVETADRLSRLFFDEAADEVLVDRALELGLETTGAVGCLARDMLDDERAARGTDRFFDGFVRLGETEMPWIDSTYVPEFDLELLDHAREASLRFATDVVLNGSGLLSELLTSRKAWVNQRLAAIYGLDADGDALLATEVGAERSGLLTQAYFLMRRASLAHGSPTQRGRGILEMFGCMSVVPPPGDLIDTVPAEFESTTRAWYDMTISSAPACAGCHVYLTRGGYAFEHFDVLGRYRVAEAGLPVDASTELYALDGTPAVADHHAAMAAIEVSPSARRCLALQWLGHAAGSLSGVQAYYEFVDATATAPTLDRMVARAQWGGSFDLRELFVAGVESPEFLAP
jgi:hypothetical protein